MAKTYKTSILSVYDENGNKIAVPAIKGKSAYEYAKDGGYVGTEEEFAANMAREIPESISLGIASDGLMYIFVDDNPVGTGIPQGNSGDVFGYVDENNTIVLTGNLVDGTYTVKYEMDNGSTVDIGNMVLVENPTEPNYTNLIPLSTNADGTPYVGDNGEDGYNTGYRIKSSGQQVEQNGTCCTGFMPVTKDDNVYVSGITLSATGGYNALVFYDADYNKIYNCTYATSGYAWITYVDGILCFDISQITTSVENAAYFRLSCASITDESIITVDEPIE